MSLKDDNLSEPWSRHCAVCRRHLRGNCAGFLDALFLGTGACVSCGSQIVVVVWPASRDSRFSVVAILSRHFRCPCLTSLGRVNSKLGCKEHARIQERNGQSPATSERKTVAVWASWRPT